MNLNFIIPSFLDSPVNFLMKTFMIVFLLFYLVFAFVIIRQVQLMTEAINYQLDNILRMIALLHFIGALFVLVLVLIVL